MSIFLRDPRASFDSRYFGASLDEGEITIWRSDSQSPIATVRPGFSGGQKRQFVDPVKRLLFSGTWVDGLTCFDYVNERIVWHRSDLIGIQAVELSAGFPGSVFVALEVPDDRLDDPGAVSGIVELSSEDGRTRWEAEKGDRVFADPKQALLVVQDCCNDVIRILDSAKSEVGSAPMIHFAILDVGFSDGMIALAEGEEGVRILNHEGDVLAHYLPEGRQANCIKVAFSEDRVIVFDSWDQSFVTIIDPHTGEVVAEYERASHGTICFIDEGLRFVDPTGQIYRSINGQYDTTLEVG